MTATAIQQVSNEDIKQAILALIRENNAEFKQFLGDALPNAKPIVSKKAPKKEAKNQVVQEEQPIKKERIPYSEMPFWKANPQFKPLNIEDSGAKPLSKEFFEALVAFAKDPELRLTDEMIKDID
jgi:hypothetical protein